MTLSDRRANRGADSKQGVAPIRVLIVEDNPGDVRLIKEAFTEAKRFYEAAIAKDGVEALDYLFGRGHSPARSAPS